MPKREDQSKTVVYVLISFVTGFGLAYLLMASQVPSFYGGMGPGMMWGSGYGMMNYMQEYRNTIDADCNTITIEELQEIGDDVMGQMIGDDNLHESIDETHPNIEVVHLMMGRMATGCY